MGDVLWNGPDPDDRDACPYSIDFKCKPAPAKTINSLESGRLMLTVRLKGDAYAAKVKAVAVRLINKAKKKNLDKVDGSSRLKRQTLLSANLMQDGRRPNRWTGEISIPVSWIEGGTRTYERTGSWTPKSKGDLFALEITYRLFDGSNCTARFGSEDAFHWAARREESM